MGSECSKTDAMPKKYLKDTEPIPKKYRTDTKAIPNRYRTDTEDMRVLCKNRRKGEGMINRENQREGREIFALIEGEFC